MARVSGGQQQSRILAHRATGAKYSTTWTAGTRPFCKVEQLQPRPIVQLHNLNRQLLGRAKKGGCQLFFSFEWRLRTASGVRRGGYVTEPRQKRAGLERRGFFFKASGAGSSAASITLGVCGVSNRRSLRKVLCGGVLG